MRKLLLLASLAMLCTLFLAMPVVAQEGGSPITALGAETAPRNADGTCPEGFVQVNAPFCAQESPNTPGRIFGYGEGDLAGPVQYTPTTAAEAIDEETPSTTTTTPLPDTGGISLLLPVAGLLLGSGLIGLGVLRRS